MIERRVVMIRRNRQLGDSGFVDRRIGTLVLDDETQTTLIPPVSRCRDLQEYVRRGADLMSEAEFEYKYGDAEAFERAAPEATVGVSATAQPGGIDTRNPGFLAYFRKSLKGIANGQVRGSVHALRSALLDMNAVQSLSESMINVEGSD